MLVEVHCYNPMVAYIWTRLEGVYVGGSAQHLGQETARFRTANSLVLLEPNNRTVMKCVMRKKICLISHSNPEKQMTQGVTTAPWLPITGWPFLFHLSKPRRFYQQNIKLQTEREISFFKSLHLASDKYFYKLDTKPNHLIRSQTRELRPQIVWQDSS